LAATWPSAKGKQRAGLFDAFKVPGDYRVEPRVAWTFLGVPALLILIGSLFARVVNVNRFSLHGFYRNRLVRAYLGASNANRKPDPFTGFAPTDNIKLHRLWPIPGEKTILLLGPRGWQSGGTSSATRVDVKARPARYLYFSGMASNL
jgi:hypothetical protein